MLQLGTIGALAYLARQCGRGIIGFQRDGAQVEILLAQPLPVAKRVVPAAWAFVVDMIGPIAVPDLPGFWEYPSVAMFAL